jgi:large subunit ribosomal protein L6
MSRIGKLPIEILNGVKATIEGRVITVEGPKGKLTHEFRPEIKVEVVDNTVVCTVAKDTKGTPAYWGLTRALIANMITGVVKGYEKKMELVGVGYRVKQNGKDVTFSVGYSHPVEFKAPTGIELKVEDNTNLTVSGVDKQLVGLTAARIRKIRLPEPYKGKGIKYSDEVIRRKAGKTGKTGK